MNMSLECLQLLFVILMTFFAFMGLVCMVGSFVCGRILNKRKEAELKQKGFENDSIT
jgi:hypothetical protein